MPSLARVVLEASVQDGRETLPLVYRDILAAIGAGTNGKRETVSLTGSSTFTALTVPSGAKAVLILVGTNASLTLKGVTGDTGIALTPSSNAAGYPVLLPLGTSPSIGILNAGTTASVEVIWL